MLFVACEQDEKLNLTDTPFANQRVQYVSTDTVTVIAKSVLSTTTVGSNASQGLFGRITDEVFGETRAAFITQFSPQSSVRWIENPIVDSVILTLLLVQQDTLTQKYIGNPDVPLSLEVYKINSTLPDTIYTNFDAENLLDMEKVGELNVSPNYADNNLKDSIYQIRLDEQSLTDDLFAVDSLTELNANDVLKGLYIKSVNPETQAILFIDLFNSVTNLAIYTHNSVDTAETKLYCGAFDMRANLFKHDYTHAVPQIQNNQVLPSEYLFLQGGGGFDIELTFPYIQNITQGQQVAVAKAELVFEEDTISTTITDPITYTYVFKLDNQGNKLYLEEYYTDDAYYAISYNQGYYSYNLAQLMQDILDNKTESQKVTIVPSYGKVDPSRTVLKSTQNNKPLKLILTFSKL